MGKSLRVLGGDELGVQDLIGSIIYTCSNWPMAVELNRSRLRNMAGIVLYLKQISDLEQIPDLEQISDLEQKDTVQSFYAPSGEYIIQEDGACDVVLWLVDPADIRADSHLASTSDNKMPADLIRPRDRLVVAVKNVDADPECLDPSSKVAEYLKGLEMKSDDSSVVVVGVDGLCATSVLRLVAALDGQHLTQIPVTTSAPHGKVCD
ncbi:hypothetical protein PCL_07418 [Purpureocillium lilacinum]|uniref:Uncharacterized protein n=1 Tax=Purpureocillium lilacinum TaxID=33203 RepID=A0A2U3DSA2_PURLI|nr:hypothetical protein PCL_07418 [Purpureocillium lilacinum]